MLYSDLGRGKAHVASTCYKYFVEIVCEADEKDSNDDPFVVLNGDEVMELDVSENLWIKNKMAKEEAATGRCNNQQVLT